MTSINVRVLDDENRAAIASELTRRITSTAASLIDETETLLKLVDAFSERHGRSLRAALAELPGALDALIPDLDAFTTHPERWSRYK